MPSIHCHSSLLAYPRNNSLFFIIYSNLQTIMTHKKLSLQVSQFCWCGNKEIGRSPLNGRDEAYGRHFVQRRRVLLVIPILNRNEYIKWFVPLLGVAGITKSGTNKVEYNFRNGLYQFLSLGGKVSNFSLGTYLWSEVQDDRGGGVQKRLIARSFTLFLFSISSFA